MAKVRLRAAPLALLGIRTMLSAKEVVWGTYLHVDSRGQNIFIVNNVYAGRMLGPKLYE